MVYTSDRESRILDMSDLNTGEQIAGTILPVSPWDLAVTPDGQMLVLATKENTLVVESSSLKIIKTLETGKTYAVSISPDGKNVAIGGKDKTVIVYSLPLLERTAEKKQHESTVRAIAFSPSSRLVVSGSDDKTAIIWRLPNLELLQTLTGHSESINVAIFPSENIVITGSADTTIRIWSLRANQPSTNQSIITHKNDVTCLASSPNGRLFASGGNDNVIFIFDSASWECTQRIECSNHVVEIRFKDNNTIIAGISNNKLFVYDVNNGSRIESAFAFHESVSGLAISSKFKVICKFFLIDSLTDRCA